MITVAAACSLCLFLCLTCVCKRGCRSTQGEGRSETSKMFCFGLGFAERQTSDQVQGDQANRACWRHVAGSVDWRPCKLRAVLRCQGMDAYTFCLRDEAAGMLDLWCCVLSCIYEEALSRFGAPCGSSLQRCAHVHLKGVNERTERKGIVKNPCTVQHRTESPFSEAQPHFPVRDCKPAPISRTGDPASDSVSENNTTRPSGARSRFSRRLLLTPEREPRVCSTPWTLAEETGALCAC